MQNPLPSPKHISRILARHDLPQLVSSISEMLSEEAEARARFRDQLSPSEKAEFINGEKVMHSPAKAKHTRVVANLSTLLRTFVTEHQLGEVFSEKALVCLTRNDYEPDICFFGPEKAATLDGETMQFPAPDFVVEVLSESAKHRDRGIKFDDYALHSTGEYWIIDCDEDSVEQYRLKDGENAYSLARKLTEGEIESEVIGGFRIPVRAIFDAATNHNALRALMT